MFFGRVAAIEAENGVLAHQCRAGERVFKKGHLLRAEDIVALAAAGVAKVTIARLEPGDIGEDQAAEALAKAAVGEGLRVDPAFTGRSNIFAREAGVLCIDVAAINAFNAIDEGLTIATLPAFRAIEAGEMVATVKIIPFALPGAMHQAGLRALAAARPAIRLAPFAPKRVGILSLRLPNLKESVIDKTLSVTKARLARLSGSLAFDLRLEHDEAALTQALRGLDPACFDLLLIFGAAAITDRRDVIPAAIEAIAGRIEHLGMPVDPGNLLLLGEVHGKPVIGAPGCARSPAENGFDWVLARLAAGLKVGRADLQAMGVGGLLMEIVSRPQPRAGGETGEAGPIAAIVLAAGTSSRFGASNKLLAPFAGRPMLARAIGTAREAGIDEIFVVTGHEAEALQPILEAAGARRVDNPSFRSGLASSLRAGIAALPENVSGVLLMLGDMPMLAPSTLQALIEAAKQEPEPCAFVPAMDGKWGNPVLLRRALFASLRGLSGDQGARKLLEAARDQVRLVEVEDRGIFADFDTQAALAAQIGQS